MRAKRFTLIAVVFGAAMAVLGLPTEGQAPAKRVVWPPLQDQWAQYFLATSGNLPGGHSEFPMGSCEARYKRNDIYALIRSSLDAAHARGIRSIDVMFFYDERMFVNGVRQVENRNPCPPFEILNPPTKSDPDIQGLIDIGTDWVRAVESFNTTCAPPCERLALRLRLLATPATLAYFYSTDPVGNGDLPAPIDCDRTRPDCDPFRPYRALVTVADGQGRFVTSPTSEVLDLSQNAIRTGVGTWLNRILDSVGTLAPTTRVEMVSLALDIGGESSLFSSRGVTEFSNMAVRYADSAKRQKFFAERQGHLKSTYAAFASAARARSVPAAVFYQSWALDDTIRGAFDLADLIAGTGVTVLHHTVWPRNYFDPAKPPLTELDHRMVVAPSATVARKLGVEMDTEFSWAWYYPAGTFFSGGIYRWINEGAFGGKWGTYYAGDFNGDRRTDILFRAKDDVTGTNSFHVALSNGFGFATIGEWFRGPDPGTLLGIGNFDGINGDDLLFRAANTLDALSVSASRANGTSGERRFAAPVQWAGPGHFAGRTGLYHVGDFNGDSRSDVLFQPEDNTSHVSLSTTGNRFDAPRQWIGPNDFGGPWGRYHVGDFNGDGKDDLLFLEPDPEGPNENTIHVTLSNSQGTGFFAPGSGMWKGKNGFGGAWSRHYVGNFDGQGGDDLMFFEPSNRTVHVAVATMRQDGTGYFHNSGVWLDPNHFGDKPDLYFPGDYTGDIKVDAAGNVVNEPDGRVDVGYLNFNSSTANGEFYVAKAGTDESIVYNTFTRLDDNARSFLSQALAGFKFDAAGMVYAQWTTGDIRVPPASDAWRAIIGPLQPSSHHLFGEGGLLVAPNTTPLPPAKYAIYLSTLGKTQCEDAGQCNFTDYLQWFDDFRLLGEIQSRQVDVLTDQMVREGSLSQYDTIFLPWEASQVFDKAACDALLKKRPPHVLIQAEKHKRGTTEFRVCP